MSTLMTRSRGAVRVAAREPAQPVNTMLLMMLMLTGIGLVMMTSASMEIGNSQMGDPLYFFKRQVFFIVVGLGLVAVALKIPMRLWYQASAPLLAVAILLLILVLII